MSLVRYRILDKNTVKSAPSVRSRSRSRNLVLLFVVFIAEKPATRRCDYFYRLRCEDGLLLLEMMTFLLTSASVSVSVSVVCCFLFPSAPTVNSTDWNALNTNGPSPRKILVHQVKGNTFQPFYSATTNFVELN
jgi:hypothetical protein